MGEIELYSPVTHCNNVCGLLRTLIFWWDALTRFHAFRAVVRFPYEISCILALVPKHGGFQIVGGLGGLWRGGDVKGCMREWVREKGGWGCCWGISWEGARAVGRAWSLRLPSFAGHNMLLRVLLPSFLARCLWKNSASFSGLTLLGLDAFVLHTFFVWDFLTGCSCFFAGRCEIPLWDVHAF
jgi:hypothetical protein